MNKSVLKPLRSIPLEIMLSEIVVEGKSPETTLPKKVQLLRTGTYHHPDYGTFTITAADLKTMKKNFDDRVRGIDLAIDYAHNSHLEAAAWFKNVELADDDSSLFAEVDWTKVGAEKVLNKEYRYISSDFDQNYVDNQTKKKFGPTLNGAALTNRPFIKGMDAVIELSEGKGVQNMDPKDEKIAGLEKEILEMKAKIEASEKKLADYAAKEEKALADQKLAEKKGKFDKMLSEKKVVEAQRKPFMDGDMDAFTANAQPLKLDEKGTSEEQSQDETGDKSAEDQVNEKAEKLISENKTLSLGKAISMVLAENPELKKTYQSRFGR